MDLKLLQQAIQASITADKNPTPEAIQDKRDSWKALEVATAEKKDVPPPVAKAEPSKPVASTVTAAAPVAPAAEAPKP